jgi:hypothetical protein
LLIGFLTKKNKGGRGMSKSNAPAWFQEKMQETADNFLTSDFQDILLEMRWDGKYYGRLVPWSDDFPTDCFLPVGYHWNLFPTEEGVLPRDACPMWTHKVYCPVCGAIDKAIASRAYSRKDFGGGKSITMTPRYWLKFLLTRVKELTGEKVPKFDDLPMFRILVVPFGVGKELHDLIFDEEKGGYDYLLNPEHGREVCFTRSSASGRTEYDVAIMKAEIAIDEEVIQAANQIDMTQLEDYPGDNSEVLLQKLRRYEKVMDFPIIAQLALSIEGETNKIKALPAGKKKIEAAEKEDEREDLSAKKEDWSRQEEDWSRQEEEEEKSVRKPAPKKTGRSSKEDMLGRINALKAARQKPAKD